jgi:hypothetical protein
VVVRRSALQRSGDKNAPQALFKPICVQYGFVFGRQPKNLNPYPAQQGDRVFRAQP